MQADSSVPSVSEGSRRSRLSAAGSRSPDIALRTIAVWRTLELALIPPPNPLQGLDTQGPDQDLGLEMSDESGRRVRLDPRAPVDLPSGPKGGAQRGAGPHSGPRQDLPSRRRGVSTGAEVRA